LPGTEDQFAQSPQLLLSKVCQFIAKIKELRLRPKAQASDFNKVESSPLVRDARSLRANADAEKEVKKLAEKYAELIRFEALALTTNQPELPPLPHIENDPEVDLRYMFGWCRSAINKCGESASKRHSRVLSAEELAILQTLNASKSPMKQVELAEAIYRSRATINPLLKQLRDDGFIYRPKGERGGDAITDLGRKQLMDTN
jgi:hypothetical protein